MANWKDYQLASEERAEDMNRSEMLREALRLLRADGLAQALEILGSQDKGKKGKGGSSGKA